MAAQAPIPVYTNLNDLYQNLGTTLNHAERWNNLSEEFVRRFGTKPSYIARAPGRVNLIGEHIDYALFGVFPAAIEQDILIACAPRHHSSHPNPHHGPGSVIAENLAPKYTRQIFSPSQKSAVPRDLGVSDEEVHVEGWHLDIDTSELRWESYVKAGYYGVLNHHFTGENAHPVPVDLLITGTVPAGSGLSSSAAMVVASTLAFLAVNGKLESTQDTISKGKLVEMAMENEKRVGVNSGGMDQAASVISSPLSALYVTFFPKLSAQPIPLPAASISQAQAGAVFICANSLVISDKLVHARTRYNLRVVETLVAARVLARRLGLPLDQGGEKERLTLREVVGRLIGEQGKKGEGEGVEVEVLKEALERMQKEVELLKPAGKEGGEEGVTLKEMIEWSGLDEDEFKEIYLSWVEVEATHFQLYKRTKHVFSEAWRVLEFRDVCLRSASPSSVPSVGNPLVALGDLMNQSQESCSKLFECSCPELDELTSIAREAGAFGSRLTGAGWGGCTVSLVSESHVSSFITTLKERYGPYRNLGEEAFKEAVFATKPSSGACVYKFED